MDRTTLETLARGFAASPDNEDLLRVLLAAYLERDEAEEAEEAAELVVGFTADLKGVEVRALAAETLFRAGRAEATLERTEDADDPAVLIWRVRALVAVDRNAEARELYQSCVRANPTLESKELAARMQLRVREVEAADRDRPRLRVLANDDTDEEDVHRLLEPEEETVRFGDVGGLEKVKRQIHRKIILPFQKPSLFERFRRRSGGGILLYGPPGCGKTLLARATAGECDAQFFNVAISDILDMYIGESERKLHAIFEKARSSTPAVLFFDELEGLAGRRQYSRDGSSAKLVSQFLSEMDGFAQNNQGVLVLGATNTPWAVDPAFRRPGRFERLMFIPPPDREARVAILEILIRDRPVSGVDTGVLAKRTSGFSGADLSHLIDSAADAAIEASLEEGREVAIDMGHFKEAFDDVRPTTTEWLTTARNYARYANEGGQYDDVLAFIKTHSRSS